MGTAVGNIHFYIRIDGGRWTYAGAPFLKNDDELISLLLQYDRQYGDNFFISPYEIEEGLPQTSYTNRQSHANIRSAIKRINNVESDWAYRSKTMLCDSLWRKNK